VSSRSAARRGAVVAVGALAFGGLATLPVMSASASPDSPAVAADSVQAQAKTTRKKTTPVKVTVKSTKCVTKKKNGKVTCKVITKVVTTKGNTKTTTNNNTKTTKTTDPITTKTTKTTKSSGGGSTLPVESHVDNPYVDAQGYVNPEWSAKAKKSGGPAAVYNQSTAVWLDRIVAIEGTDNSVSNGPMGLRDHLDEALAQQSASGKRVAIQIVVYDLPGRDCSALASNGELKYNEIDKYKGEYIDPIAEIMSDSKYASLRIVAIIEPDSLPNLVTNTGSEAGATEMCNTVKSAGSYEAGVTYALSKLGKISNVYTYLDAGHHGWLGWSNNIQKVVPVFKQVISASGAKVDGFVVNLANYSATEEPYLTPVTQTIGGMPLRSDTTWLDWNDSADEVSYATALRTAMGGDYGMLIDTSRNGWGGANRPTKASTSTNIATYVKESRIDRRIHAGNWCNQDGAGIGERPTAAPKSGIDAYVWIKPPGESDGNSEEVQNTEGKGFDRMCDPTYSGSSRQGKNMNGAMWGAPLAGAWFEDQFTMLLANAYPPLD
jgi:cellulose 1,4-beta-cellobiosidase